VTTSVASLPLGRKEIAAINRWILNTEAIVPATPGARCLGGPWRAEENGVLTMKYKKEGLLSLQDVNHWLQAFKSRALVRHQPARGDAGVHAMGLLREMA